MKKSTLRPTALKVTVLCGDITFTFETREFNIGQTIRAELVKRSIIAHEPAKYWIGDNPSCGTLYR